MLLVVLVLLVYRDELAVRTGHICYHPAGYFGSFLRDCAGGGDGVHGVVALVRVAACGDEEGEVEEPGCGSVS